MSVAERARHVADRIENLPNQVVESFKAERPVNERVRLIQQSTGEIGVLALPIVSWLERRAHPDQAALWKHRFLWATHEPVECVRQEIPEYANGLKGLEGGLPGNDRSSGVHQTATFGAFCCLIAPALRDLAADISADELSRESASQNPLESSRNKDDEMPLSQTRVSALRTIAGKSEWPIAELLGLVKLATLVEFDRRRYIRVRYCGLYGLEKSYSPVETDGGIFAAIGCDEWDGLVSPNRSKTSNPRVFITSIGKATLDEIDDRERERRASSARNVGVPSGTVDQVSELLTPPGLRLRLRPYTIEWDRQTDDRERARHAWEIERLRFALLVRTERSLWVKRDADDPTRILNAPPHADWEADAFSFSEPVDQTDSTSSAIEVWTPPALLSRTHRRSRLAIFDAGSGVAVAPLTELDRCAFVAAVFDSTDADTREPVNPWFRNRSGMQSMFDLVAAHPSPAIELEDPKDVRVRTTYVPGLQFAGLVMSIRDVPLIDEQRLSRIVKDVETLLMTDAGKSRPTPKSAQAVNWDQFPIWSPETEGAWITNKAAAARGGFLNADKLGEYRKPSKGATFHEDGRGVDKFGQVFFTPPNRQPVYLNLTIRENPRKNPGNQG